jgi:hypothetical protein
VKAQRVDERLARYPLLDALRDRRSRRFGIGYSLGLERGSEILSKPYCPPYYPSIEAAVREFVGRKFGPQGVFALGEAAYCLPSRTGGPNRRVA